MHILRRICLSLVLFVGVGWADEESDKTLRRLDRSLVVEYRIRVSASNLMADVALFDDMGALGREISTMKISQAAGETAVAGEDSFLPDQSFGPPVQHAPFHSVSMVMSLNALDPLADIRLDMRAVQEAKAEAKKKGQRKKDPDPSIFKDNRR